MLKKCGELLDYEKNILYICIDICPCNEKCGQMSS